MLRLSAATSAHLRKVESEICDAQRASVMRAAACALMGLGAWGELAGRQGAVRCSDFFPETRASSATFRLRLSTGPLRCRNGYPHHPSILYKHIGSAEAAQFVTKPEARFRFFMDLDDLFEVLPPSPAV